MSMPVVGDAQPREEEPDRERVGAADLEPGTGAPMDLGPGPQEHLQPLAGLLAAGEGDRVLAPGRIDGVGDEHAVRDDLVVAGEPARRRVPRPLGDGDPLVDPAREEAPGGDSELHPAEVARGMVRRDDRRGRHREHRDAGHRRHRLVQVEHVEALPLEHAPDPEDRPRAEDDVRQRPVRGHDHRPADRDHVRGRVAVAADPGVQGARELTGWVVAHHQPHLVPARLERLGLQLGMLDDRAPERPRERHHDADLHAGSLFTPRSRRGGRAPRSPRARRARPRRSGRGTCCARPRGGSAGPARAGRGPRA